MEWIASWPETRTSVAARTAARATRVYNIKPRAYHSLRNGKKAAIRRRVKRAARREGKIACRVD
jgi:hypothetical protein